MNKLEIPYFGEIDLQSPEDYLDAEFILNGITVRADLNNETGDYELQKLLSVKNLLESLPELDLKIKKYLEEHLEDEENDTVRFYIQHHLDEFDKEELSRLFDSNNMQPLEIQMLNKLHLVRIGFFTDSEDSFATLDYSIGEDLTNYLLVVLLNEQGDVTDMLMES